VAADAAEYGIYRDDESEPCAVLDQEAIWTQIGQSDCFPSPRGWGVPQSIPDLIDDAFCCELHRAMMVHASTRTHLPLHGRA
jgi:hypothetical protein